MSQTAKLDFTRPDQHGLTLGLNEFAGYAGVAAAGVATAYLTESSGMRAGLLVFGLAVIAAGTLLTVFGVPETLHFVNILSGRQSFVGRPRRFERPICHAKQPLEVDLHNAAGLQL